MKYTRAIVRLPGKSIISGLSSAEKAPPVYDMALQQHQQYIAVLEKCGLRVHILEAIEAYPDSTFVEDVAVLTPFCAVLTAPGTESRADEVTAIRQPLLQHFSQIERIEFPGTLEGGDIMQVGNHYYIGLSNRTNYSGAQQLIDILKKYGLTGSTIPVKTFLHLKTGVTWIGKNTLVAADEFIVCPDFQSFHILPVTAREQGAANCIAINGKVIMAAGYPETKALIEQTGTEIIKIDISEFTKIDGGLTCLSLRF